MVTNARGITASKMDCLSSPTSSSDRRLLAIIAEDLIGSYECSQYVGTSVENPWHHVTISSIKDGGGSVLQKFCWKNRAGVTWTLIYDDDEKDEQREQIRKLKREEEWSSLEEGDIFCGPGSYYLHDATITGQHEGITTLEEAKRFVEEENNSSEGRNNPIVIWQLSNPWVRNIAQHLIFHRQKFLHQNLDASTGKTAGDFCREVSDHGKGNRSGSPMFFKPNAKKTVNDQVVGTNNIKMRVSTDCPYYEDGHFHCTVERDGQGKIVALLGPGGERYSKVDKNRDDDEENGPVVSSIEDTSSNENHKQDTASNQKTRRGTPLSSSLLTEANTTRAMKGQQMKSTFLREKAHKLGWNNKEVQRKQELRELRDTMTTTMVTGSDSNATRNDAAQQVLQMKTFTNHLASIAANIHKIGSLNKILAQQDKKVQLDNLTNQLFDNMLELAKQSPFVNADGENHREEEEEGEEDIENIDGMNDKEDVESEAAEEHSTGNSMDSSSSMDDFVEIN